MRAPQPRTIKSMRATQPSTPPPTARTTGPQGTPGGVRRMPGASKRSFRAGQEMYLWALVLIEIALIGGFRKFFRRFHGG